MFNFDQIIDRRTDPTGKNWTGGVPLPAAAPESEIEVLRPADLSYPIAAPIREVLSRIVDKGVLGYCGDTAAYAEAAVLWQRSRFRWHADPDWLVSVPGSTEVIRATLQAFTHPGDSILVLTPSDHRFLRDVLPIGRHVTKAPLAFERSSFHLDPEMFEAAIVPGTRVFLLSNPHGPIGKVWSREDLSAMAAICERHGVLVLADESLQDMIHSRDSGYTSFAALDRHAAHDGIVFNDPVRSFNIPGLRWANAFIRNPERREAFRLACGAQATGKTGSLGTAVCEVAYEWCEPWVDLRSWHLQSNYLFLRQCVRHLALPIEVVQSQSSDAVYLDFSSLGMPGADIRQRLFQRGDLWMGPALPMGWEERGFLALHIGYPMQALRRVIDHLAQALLF